MIDRFRYAILTGALCALLAFALGGCGAIGLQRHPDNFQEILDRAKKQVFPALVFVKPIVEDFESGEKRKHQVFGSGVIISPDGLVVTNNHVVEKAIQVHCVLSDKDQVPAEILGRDPDTDLALLQLKNIADKKPLPFGEFADSSQLRAGDFVMALGSPFGFNRSISLGILSNTQRYLGFETQFRYNTWLQTDAAINPGNSGGPLVNIDGKIVGINTLGIFFGENIGFSIPSNIVRDIAAKLETNRRVQRAWTGLKLQPLKDFFSDTFTDAERGVLISHVEEASPAQKAGMVNGDILIQVNDWMVEGTYIEDLPEIERRLADLPVGEPAEMVCMRGDREERFSLTPTRKGKVEGEDFDMRRWNMTVQEINKHKTPTLFYFHDKGIYVQGVRRPGNAAFAGVQRGEVLTKIDGEEVQTLEDAVRIYQAIMADENREKKVLLELNKKRQTRWVVLDYSKDFDEEE